MAWLKLDDKIRSHPKILRAGPEACWLWVCCLSYASDHLVARAGRRRAGPSIERRTAMPHVIGRETYLSLLEAARALPGAVSPDDIAAICRRLPDLGARREGKFWRIPRRALPRIARLVAEHEPGARWRPDQDRRGRT